MEKWFVGDEERDDGEKSGEAVKLINLTTSSHNFLFPLMFLSPSMHSTSYFGICPNTAVLSSSALLYALLMRSAMHGVRRCSYRFRLFLAYESCSHFPLLTRHTKGKP